MIRFEHPAAASIALADASLPLSRFARPVAAQPRPSSSLAASPYAERWVYCSFNLQVDRSVDDLIALFDRAKRSGYTGILLADYKFQVLDRVPDNYFRNVEQVKAAAAAGRPRAGPRGLLDRLQQRPPGARPQSRRRPAGRRSAVSSSRAVIEPVPQKGSRRQGSPALAGAAAWRPCSTRSRSAQIRNGGLEETKGDQFLKLLVPGRPGRTARSPTARSSTADASLAASSPDRRPRGIPRRTSAWSSASPLRPHTAYRFSCWVKTRDLAPTGSFQLLALGTSQAGGQLTFHEGGLEPTQDWKRVEVVFNSLDRARGQPLRRLLGRGKRDLLGRRPGARRAGAGQRPAGARAARSSSSRPTAGRPTRKAATSSRSPTPSSARFPGRANTSSTIRAHVIRITPRLADQERRPAPRELVSPGHHPRLSGHVLPERAQARADPARPGPAHQRAVPPQDVLHVARRDPRGQLVPGLPGPQADARASFWPTTSADARRSSSRSTRGPGSSSGRTCSTRITTRSTTITWSTARSRGRGRASRATSSSPTGTAARPRESLCVLRGPRPSTDHRRAITTATT